MLQRSFETMSKSTYQIIEIPLKPHLIEFTVRKLGAQPIKISQTTLFGQLFLSLLKRNNYYKPQAVEDGEKLQVALSTSRYIEHIDPRTHELVIDDEFILKLNRFMDRLFDQEMYSYLKGAQVAEKEVKACCLRFLEEYNITEDQMKLESAYKRFQRMKKQLDANRATA